MPIFGKSSQIRRLDRKNIIKQVRRGSGSPGGQAGGCFGWSERERAGKSNGISG